MSFSSLVKQELLRVQPEKPCCMLSELTALTQTRASLHLSGGGRVRVVYEVESAPLAKRIFMLLKKRLEITPVLSFARYGRLGGRRACVLTVQEGDSRRLLVALHMLREEGGAMLRGMPRSVMTRRCCRAAFVRGMFLGAGAASSPEKGYHMEFVVSESRAQGLLDVLTKSGVPAQMTGRRGQKLVYIKKGDDVVSALALMGAHGALLEMENIRIRRESRNQANRARNCDEANLNKQLSAGSAQAQTIVAYSLRHGLGGLEKDLQALARLRMLHPEASLQELGEMLSPPIGKSGVNHRMRRLMAALAENKIET